MRFAIRVFGFVTALLIPVTTAAAVQVLKIQGPVHYTIGVLDPPKPLTKNTKLQPAICIFACDGGYVERQAHVPPQRLPLRSKFT